MNRIHFSKIYLVDMYQPVEGNVDVFDKEYLLKWRSVSQLSDINKLFYFPRFFMLFAINICSWGNIIVYFYLNSPAPLFLFLSLYLSLFLFLSLSLFFFLFLFLSLSLSLSLSLLFLSLFFVLFTNLDYVKYVDSEESPKDVEAVIFVKRIRQIFSLAFSFAKIDRSNAILGELFRIFLYLSYATSIFIPSFLHY